MFCLVCFLCSEMTSNHSSGPVLGEEVQEDLPRRRLQVDQRVLFWIGSSRNIFLLRFYRLSDRLILNNALDTEMGSSDIDSAMRWSSILVSDWTIKDDPCLIHSMCWYFLSTRYFRAITEYMQQLRHSLGELRDDIEWALVQRWKWARNSQWSQFLRFDVNPGLLHKRSWMLLMQKRSLALQSSPSLGGTSTLSLPSTG